MAKLIYQRHHSNLYYGLWGNIKRRCYDPNHKNFDRYGGRGITVDDRWLGKRGFDNFMDDMGPKPTPKHTLDRIDNDRGYSPKNCQWATWVQQANNRSNNRFIEINGESKTLAQWTRLSGLKGSTVRQRIGAYGWSVEKALGMGN